MELLVEMVSKLFAGVLSTVGVLLGLLVAYVVYCRIRLKKLDAFPGPPRHWLVGNLHQIHVGPLVLQDAVNWMREFGDCFRIWSVSFPVLVLCGPDPIKDFMKKDTPKGLVYTLLHEWLGEGLLTANGESHKRKRRLFTPAFHFSILKDYVKIYSQCSEKLIKKWETAAETGETIDISPQITALTLDIIGICAFNTELGAQSAPPSSFHAPLSSSSKQTKEPASESISFVSAIYEASDLIFKRIFSPMNVTAPTRYSYWFTRQGRKMLQATRIIHNLSERVIREKKAIKASNPENTKKTKYQSFLDILLSAGDPDTSQPLSDLEMRNEVDTFMFEGHDTTAASLAWTFYLLAKHEDIQTKVREEIKSILGDKDHPEPEDLSQFKYLEMVIKESLRLYPPVPFITRNTSEPASVDGHYVPAGIEVFICPYVIHRNPRYWEEPVEKFDPERFTYENMQKRDPFAYIPFSAGNRNCIGQNFALMEEKTLIAILLKRFELRLNEGDSPAIAEPNLILRPQNGVKVTIHKV